jgi:phosphatidylserine/phosphatidylglycerophosphate/cardiolipin synthase-like enzyme
MEKTANVLYLTFLVGIAFKGIQYWNLNFIYDTKDIDRELNDLFSSSKYFLYIVSPYFIAGENRLKYIIDAQNFGCEVTILVHRNALKDSRTINELTRLSDFGCKIFVHPNLHSKIYLNETTAITGSVNLLTGSLTNSYEIGVATQNVKHHKDMLNTILYYLDDDKVEPFDPTYANNGYCIKTKMRMPYSIGKPIDQNAFEQGDRNRDWKYCHKCGKDAETTVTEPLCKDCK